MSRKASLQRNTFETSIDLSIDIDGKGINKIETGIGFFDHMLTHISKHGFFDLMVSADGDLDVDCHHTVEDVGITLGKCISKALGDKSGITRYGHCVVPMDETLVLCAIDISGRPYLGFDAQFTQPVLGMFELACVEEFFSSICSIWGTLFTFPTVMIA